MLSSFAATLRFEDIPEEVIERIKLLFMDLSGIMVRSQGLDSTIVLKEALRDLGLNHGSARVMGSFEGWTPQAAALLAGAAPRAAELAARVQVASAAVLILARCHQHPGLRGKGGAGRESAVQGHHPVEPQMGPGRRGRTAAPVVRPLRG